MEYDLDIIFFLPFQSGIMEGAVIMGLVGYLSVSAMLMLIDCKYAILTSGGRAGGRNIIMDTKVNTAYIVYLLYRREVMCSDIHTVELLQPHITRVIL